MGVVVEGAGDEHVETGVACLAGGSDQIGARDRAELGADEDGGALFGAGCFPAFEVAAVSADQIARPRGQRREADLVFLVRLLHAGGLEVFQDHLDEVAFFAVAGFRLRCLVDQFVVFIDGQDAVGRQAFDRERPGDADLLLVLVGLVVEGFELGLGGDGSVDFLLAGDAGLPPVGVQFLRGIGPFSIDVSGDFPLLPLLAQRLVDLLTQRFKHLLELVPDDVDLGVVGNGLQRDVRHALVDKTLANVAERGLAGGHCAGDFGFLDLAFAAVGEQVKGIAGAHDASTCQCQCDA